MNPKTVKLIAAVLAELDGILVEIPTADTAAATRIALALAQPGSKLAKAADYARVDSSERLLEFKSPDEAAMIRALQEQAGRVTKSNDETVAKLGREIGCEYRALVVGEQIKQLRAMPEPVFSFIGEDAAKEFRELAANPSRPVGPYYAHLQNELGLSTDTVREVSAAYRAHHRAQASAEQLERFLESDFSPSHVESETPRYTVALIESRAADEMVVHREQQTLKAEEEALARRKAELSQAQRDNRSRSKIVDVNEAARRQAEAADKLGGFIKESSDKAKATEQDRDAALAARVGEENVPFFK